MNILLEGESYLSPPLLAPPDVSHSTNTYPMDFATSPIPNTSNTTFVNHPVPGTSSGNLYPASLSSAPISGSLYPTFSQTSVPSNSYPAQANSPVSSSNHRHKKTYASQCNGNSIMVESSPQPIYSVLVANEGNKITIKRKVPDEYNMSAVVSVELLWCLSGGQNILPH